MFDVNPQYLVRLDPQRSSFRISQSRTLFEVDEQGVIPPGSRYGLFVSKTRLLSTYRYSVDGRPLLLNVGGNVKQHNWLGYFIAPHPSRRLANHGRAETQRSLSEETLELKVCRYIGDGAHEDLDFSNFSNSASTFRFTVEIDADFIDQDEIEQERQQFGEINCEWNRADDGAWELRFDYRAEHPYRHQEESGIGRLHRGLTLRVFASDSEPRWEAGALCFDVSIPARGHWHACFDMRPSQEGRELTPQYGCRAFFGNAATSVFDRRRESFLDRATGFLSPTSDTLTPLVCALLERCKEDLAALRLYDLDHDSGWVMAAGLPLYIALFGRDTLTAAGQSAMLGPEMIKGTLAELARWQGKTVNNWRDEAPGRMLHEAHDSPTGLLGFNPRARYYGSITTSAVYPLVLAQLWHWTGDRSAVEPWLGPARQALDWLDRCTDLRGDGFHYYQTHSEQGVKNQAWKDSHDAIVDRDGREIAPPIATCEEQAYAYGARFMLAEMLWALGAVDDAKALYARAADLRKRFNDAFWMEDEGSFALGLDGEGRQIRSVTSNPGHCLAMGIADLALVPRAAHRLMAPDMFSGWGVRTLSASNPAFNPYSYHRGSVWPAEHGTFALGFFRHGLWHLLHRLSRAIFEAAALFDFYRLPEVFSGHSRDEDHPFPALYPKTNWPQAWSASAMFLTVESLLGLYPYAPLHLLFVDPHLPEWLPDLTVAGLRVGNARLTLRCFRKENGESDYRIESLEGKLHVIRQPSPWSLAASHGERLFDLLSSFVPTHR